MSLSEHISRVIKSARELKKIAGEMGNIELKSRLLDEIDKLQELRESLAESGELAQFHASNEASEPSPIQTREAASGDSAIHVVKPAEAGETYEIHVDLVASDDDHQEDAVSSDADGGPGDEQQAERFRLAEAILRKLEPTHQAILKKMNDVLTEDQKIKKLELTRDGQSAGKSPNQIQQEVMAALELTDKQRQLLATARKELHDIRAKIAREVDSLLTVEQRKRLQRKILKEIAAGR